MSTAKVGGLTLTLVLSRQGRGEKAKFSRQRRGDKEGALIKGEERNSLSFAGESHLFIPIPSAGEVR